MKTFIRLPVTGINAIVADHLEAFLGYVLSKTLHEFESRDSFFNVFVIFMAVIVKGDHLTIITVDTFGGYDRSTEITTDILGDRIGIALIGLSIYVETIFVFSIDQSLDRFERWTDMHLHFIKKSSTEGITKKMIVEVRDFAPGDVVSGTAFSDKAMYMRIPLKASAKSVHNADKTWSETFGLVLQIEHTKDDAPYSKEEAVKQVAVNKKKVA